MTHDWHAKSAGNLFDIEASSVVDNFTGRDTQIALAQPFGF